MKPTKHTYILVFTEQGPKYVTKINYSDKTAEWNKSEKPLDFQIKYTKYIAENILTGLIANFFNAVLINQEYEITSQPYNYENFKIKWEER